METGTHWIVISFCVCMSAYFSGMEIAFVSANRLKIELDKNAGSISGRIVAFFARQPAKFIGAMLVGNNIVIVVYGIFFAELMEPWLRLYIHNSGIITAIQVMVSTLVILVLAEFLPKAIFRINPNGVMRIFAIPAYLFYWFLYPVVSFSVWISEMVLRIFGQKYSGEELSFGRVDLDHLIKEATEENQAQSQEEVDHEIKIFKNALEFADVKARDCMIPRKEIIAIDVNAGLEALRALFVETGLSKILVYENSIDNIIGYVHSFALFRKPADMRSILIPALEVQESYPAQSALSDLIKQRKSLALVIDEYGGTSGIITTEDIMEEIFGEIEDEHDQEELTERVIDENEFVFSARQEIKYLNEKYGFDLPESEQYSTLAGLIIDEGESIPEKDAVVSIGRFEFIILKSSGARIEEVKLTVKAE
ncbi:MAG: HlyC/CorC family transporter [Bacteroidia bacterium]|nr:HlyC/CorC family transporter [Bacteroidia bacterium]